MASQPSAQSSQDPVRVDSKHYTVETEDNSVRVLRARYGPGEKSTMHSHPSLVAIMMTAANIRMTYPDGTTEEMTATPGQVMLMPALEHMPENIGSEPFEVILIELKR
jgi:quercetin dioxygenase-like cupin family protein